MPKSYIPKNEAQFAAWFENLATRLNANKSALNVPTASLDALTNLQTSYQQAFDEEEEARIAFEAKRQARITSRSQAEALARAAVRIVQAGPDTTDELRAELQIPIRDTTPTPTPPITSRPIITIDFSQRRQHELDFRDSETPTRRARPANATGCEFRSYVGDSSPTGISQFKYVDTASKTPFTVEYGDEEAGKTAYYIARWVNTVEKGPWSETVNATIAG